MTRTETWPGRIVLMVAHCAGMVDLVALPVWVGTLISHCQLDPQQAGGLGGTFVKAMGYGSIGFAVIALTSFSRAGLNPVQA